MKTNPKNPPDFMSTMITPTDSNTSEHTIAMKVATLSRAAAVERGGPWTSHPANTIIIVIANGARKSSSMICLPDSTPDEVQ
jgi:hypothetical protein